MPEVLAQILFNRGYTSREAVQRFLAESAHPVDPWLLKDMDQAVNRLWRAIDEREPIAVYGDFDCDGVTATVLLTQALRLLGAVRVRPYIPDRVDEGYGLNTPALEKLYQEGYRVVVTVDCGIRSIQEVVDGNLLGLDIIISDHHSIGPRLPPALAVINPKQEGCQYPEKMLAGVGLAYKLVCALHDEGVRRGAEGIAGWHPQGWLDLVAIGTVADIAPLRGENRGLVREGLKLLNHPSRLGLRALYGAAGIRPGTITATTIGFAIGPRINAAGRLRTATLAGKLLSAVDPGEAEQLALELNALNQERQQKTLQMQSWAEENLTAEPAQEQLLFAADPRFEQGVVGLVASRLTEQYYRPSVVVQVGQYESHGSCRSIPEFHITQALDACHKLLERYGGHAAAAGFTIHNENLPALREQLTGIASSQLDGRDLQPTLSIDAEINLDQCNELLATALNMLEPCGEANPAPVFMTRNLQISSRRQIGADGKHLKLELNDGHLTVEAIAFRMGNSLDMLPEQIDVAYTLEVNEWNAQRRIQLNVQDIHPSLML